jgi:hypothetical protein
MIFPSSCHRGDVRLSIVPDVPPGRAAGDRFMHASGSLQTIDAVTGGYDVRARTEIWLTHAEV